MKVNKKWMVTIPLKVSEKCVEIHTHTYKILYICLGALIDYHNVNITVPIILHTPFFKSVKTLDASRCRSSRCFRQKFRNRLIAYRNKEDLQQTYGADILLISWSKIWFFVDCITTVKMNKYEVKWNADTRKVGNNL